MPMFNVTARWRCKCGTFVVVRGEADEKNPQDTSTAACPKCGLEQIIHASHISSITIDIQAGGPPQSPAGPTG